MRATLARACLRYSRTTLPTATTPPHPATPIPATNSSPILRSPRMNWPPMTKRNNSHPSTSSRKPSLSTCLNSGRSATVQTRKRDWMRRKISGRGEIWLEPSAYATQTDCFRFCKGAKCDPVECLSQLSDTETAVRFLKAFFSWRCRQRRGKNGRRNPGIKHKSSLDSLWKWWHLIYKAEVGHELSKDIQVKIRDVRSPLCTGTAIIHSRLTIHRCSR